MAWRAIVSVCGTDLSQSWTWTKRDGLGKLSTVHDRLRDTASEAQCSTYLRRELIFAAIQVCRLLLNVENAANGWNHEQRTDVVEIPDAIDPSITCRGSTTTSSER